MGQILFFILNAIILAVAIATGAVFLVFFAGALVTVALFLFVYAKITGRMPGNIRFYRFEQRVREEQVTPTQKVIEAEYEEINR